MYTADTYSGGPACSRRPEASCDTDAMQESTERAAMLSTSARRGSAGTLLYTYDYRIDTTRGRKRIISTVCVPLL